MKIKRFDEAEYKALQCGKSGGYYREEHEEGKRAILLMEEGIYKQNPINHWHIDGWKFTSEGEKYYTTFMKKVQKKHGHVWMTNYDSDPEYNTGEYGKQINIFAMSGNYHNGPKCKKCGYEFCRHCTNEMKIPNCTG